MSATGLSKSTELESILIVNHRCDQRLGVEDSLRKAGYSVLTADDSLAAFNIAKQYKPHLIISPVCPCTANGFEFFRLVRTDEDLGSVPILLLNGLLEENSGPVDAFHSNTDDCLNVPFDDLQLVAKVSGLLEQSRSRAYYQKLVEQGNDVIFTQDLFGRLTNINAAGTKFIGRNSAELIGQSFSSVFDLFGLESNKDGLATYFQHPQTNQQLRHQFKARRLSGEKCWLDLTISPLRDKSNKTIGFLGLIRDVTERKQIESALRESEERYRLLFETTPQSILVYDEEIRRFLTVNEAATRTYGYSRDEFLSMTIDDLTDPSMDEDSVSSGKGCAYKHRTKTREIIYVEMSFHPLVFDDRFCKLVIISDITERKLLDQAQQRMHASLTQSATEWRQTFDTLDFPVLIVDREGRIHRANYCARQILGAGQHVRDLGEPKLGAKACEMLEALRQSETSISEILREETTGKSWSVSLFPVSKFRSTDRAILIVHDTTKEAELEASVRENKIMSALGTVVAGVAHEVRNPLFALSSILDALERRFSDRPEFQSYNDVLRSQIDRLIVLMEDLLEYGKPHVNDQSPESLAEMIGSSIRTCRRSAEAARITVVNCVDDKLPRIMVDKRRIATVFTNLIENAIQHSPPNSVIKIEAGKAAQGNQQWIECLVTDFGPGIKDEDLPRIFEPFFSKRPGGTGLGLPIAKKTMQEHGGGLFARNRPEGGACLIARFPIASEVNTNG